MHYLMFIVSDGSPLTDARRAAIDEIEGWAEDLSARGVRLLGRPLELPDTAVSVRVRDGDTLVTDGPFIESREFVGGFDLLACADLDEALDVAVHRPHCTVAAEVRPLHPGFALSDRAREWAAMEPSDSWCAFFGVDGIPASDEVEARIVSEGREWEERWERAGALVCAAGLACADTATTVREHDRGPQLIDGPFVRAPEFIGGFAILQGLDRDAVIAAVAEHPLAVHHPVELRRFLDA